MRFRPEVNPFLVASAVFGGLVAGVWAGRGGASGHAVVAGLVAAAVSGAYMLYFFRDPKRTPPPDTDAVLAAADGHIARLTRLETPAFQAAVARSRLTTKDLALFGDAPVMRISIFLSPFDVHVNRAPIAGTGRFLGYFPGKHLFTFDEKSSDENQHNAILIVNDHLPCLLTQIVGPICRRVVYWLDHDHPHPVAAGQSIGMMKFGSRLDMYFPADRIALCCEEGDVTRAGETVIARLIFDK
jgi:phosphatidylserine decarboxylase